MTDYTRQIGVTQETGLVELVGKDEAVNTNDYGASVEVELSSEISGEFVQFVFVATEEGSGAVQDSAGYLFIFDTDPDVDAGDTAITAAAHKTVLGVVTVAAADWVTDANGGVAVIVDQTVAFHELASVYFVWKHTDAVDLNDAAGDDEVLEVNAWYRADSN